MEMARDRHGDRPTLCCKPKNTLKSTGTATYPFGFASRRVTDSYVSCRCARHWRGHRLTYSAAVDWPRVRSSETSESVYLRAASRLHMELHAQPLGWERGGKRGGECDSELGGERTAQRKRAAHRQCAAQAPPYASASSWRLPRSTCAAAGGADQRSRKGSKMGRNAGRMRVATRVATRVAAYVHFQLSTRRGKGPSPRKVAMRPRAGRGAAANSSRVSTSA